MLKAVGESTKVTIKSKGNQKLGAITTRCDCINSENIAFWR